MTGFVVQGHIFDAKLNVSTFIFGKLYMIHIIAMHKQYRLCFCVAEYYVSPLLKCEVWNKTKNRKIVGCIVHINMNINTKLHNRWEIKKFHCFEYNGK